MLGRSPSLAAWVLTPAKRIAVRRTWVQNTSPRPERHRDSAGTSQPYLLCGGRMLWMPIQLSGYLGTCSSLPLNQVAAWINCCMHGTSPCTTTCLLSLGIEL